MRREHRHRGFTLIELLVVIAIIAVLASILVPTVQNALNRAYSITCSSNLRSLGTFMNSWLHDHDGKFWRLYWSPDEDGDGTSEWLVVS